MSRQETEKRTRAQMEEEWKVPYYYGTYTCPECGSRGILIEWMKETEM